MVFYKNYLILLIGILAFASNVIKDSTGRGLFFLSYSIWAR